VSTGWRCRIRSVVDAAARGEVTNLLTELAEAVDPDVGGDVQLIDVRVELTADKKAISKLSAKAVEAGAKWTDRGALGQGA